MDKAQLRIPESEKQPRPRGYRRSLGVAGFTALSAAGCVSYETTPSVVTGQATPVAETSVPGTTVPETTVPDIAVTTVDTSEAPQTTDTAATSPETISTTSTQPSTTEAVTSSTEQIPPSAVEVRPTKEVEPGLFVGTATINVSQTGETITQDIYVSEISADIEHDPALSKGLMAHYDRAIPGVNEVPSYPTIIGGHRRTLIDATADDTDQEVPVLNHINLIKPGDTMLITLASGETRSYVATEMTAQPVVRLENGMDTVHYFNVPSESDYDEVRLYACTGYFGDEAAVAAQSGTPIHDTYLDGNQSASQRYIVTFERTS